MSYVYDREDLNKILEDEGISPIPETMDDDIYGVEMVALDEVVEWEGEYYHG